MAKILTVILPVYNGMPYLPKAVESVLGQTFTDFDFIIVNDGSTDDSGAYLNSLQDPRVTIISQDNAGQGAARNTALHHARSEYVAVMDQDDVSKPDRFLYQLEYLAAHADVVFVGTQIEFLIGSTTQRAFKSPVDPDEIESRLRKGRAGICHPSLMFRASAAIACGGYPTEGFGEDIDFCLRILDYGRGANLNRVEFQYRLHPAQASLARCKELISANSYAAYNATCRRMGLPAVASDAFLRSASYIRRIRWSFEAWELIQYRTARINLASGKPVLGTLRLGCLGMLRPFAVIARVAHALREWSAREDGLT